MKEMGRDLPLSASIQHSSREEEFGPAAELRIGRTPPITAHSLLDVGAVRGGWGVNPAIRLGRIEGNELDSDRGCHDRAFVPNDVHVAVTWIDERRGGLPWDKCVDMGRAVVLVLRNGPRRNNDQAVAWVRVPARGGYRAGQSVDRRPDIALNIQV